VATDVVVDYARAQRDAIRAGGDLVRRDEPEAVHDMRVAIRRLRSTLRTFRPLWDKERARPVRDELKWLADLLGAVRDGEVMLKRLTDAVHAEPPELVVGQVAARIRQRLGAEIAEGRERLLAGFDSPRYRRLLDAVDAIVDEAAAKSVGRKKLRKRAAKAIRRADDALDAADGSDTRLHEARKDYKRARYAVEALAADAGKPAGRLTRRLKDLQDILGTHQDTVVTAQLLRAYWMRAHIDGDNAFTYGLLHGRQRAAGERVLLDLPAATKASRRRKVRRWLPPRSR
jgi:CHAD domain-containing protein